jgi:hypothetical protein
LPAPLAYGLKWFPVAPGIVSPWIHYFVSHLFYSNIGFLWKYFLLLASASIFPLWTKRKRITFHIYLPVVIPYPNKQGAYVLRKP